MRKRQFRILYREFLFRVIDLDALAPQGDMSRLLGQFAALLLLVGLWVLLPATALAANPPSELALMVTWAAEHFLIATTMLVVGLFAVLSWESLFPDRRDVQVLMPLPIRESTLFLAKIAAVATALAVSVLVLNAIPGLAAGFAFSNALTMPPPKYDAAIPPVGVDEVETVLDRDLAATREPGSSTLKLGKDAVITIGILQGGASKVFSIGTPRTDFLFEIGSLTKTFTGLLLARMAAEGKVRLDEPVRELLPPGLVSKPKGREVTLLDLATHHSGLPGMPDNFKPVDMRNPYADYHVANLYQYIAKRGIAKEGRPEFLYSNLGFGLLGQALANGAGTTYAKLLEQEITGPLGMIDTAIVLTPEQTDRFIWGHSGNGRHHPVHAWDLDALAGAGGIRSTASDMLRYLDAQLHPERFGAMADALVQSHRLEDEISDNRRIALAWIYDRDSGIYEHAGATGGYTSYAFFDPKHDWAAVALINTGPSLVLLPEQLGEHIRERLAGQPAISLAPPVVSGSGSFLHILRSFAAYWVALFAGSTFILCSLLTVQGLAQLLPRQLFLRVSSFLQLACFCLLLTGYFLQPSFAGPDVLLGKRWLGWLPSYCFFGIFQQLNGPLHKLLAPLAQRAWMELAVSIGGAAASYAICYYRTFRKIMEEPDIQPAVRQLHWLPRFGNSLETAVGQFCIRTLFRSRQHRVILSFYLGIALGLAIFVAKAPVLRGEGVSAPLVVSSVLMICGAVLGGRIVFSIPLELKANWIFQVVPAPEAGKCLSATRRALYGIAVLPVWCTMAVYFLWDWPWGAAIGHLIVLGLLGAMAAEMMLHGFRKIPFTCSYLPGKSYFHMAFLALVGVMVLVNKGAAWEVGALVNWRRFGTMVGVLFIGLFAAWRWTSASARSAEVQFEEEREPAVMELGLVRDGVFAGDSVDRRTPGR